MFFQYSPGTHGLVCGHCHHEYIPINQDTPDTNSVVDEQPLYVIRSHAIQLVPGDEERVRRAVKKVLDKCQKGRDPVEVTAHSQESVDRVSHDPPPRFDYRSRPAYLGPSTFLLGTRIIEHAFETGKYQLAVWKNPPTI